MLTRTAVILLAYLLGSIPFGLILVRLRTGKDVRQSGSGNIGATNVLRTTGKAWGVITLLLDAAKGAAAVLVARALLPEGSLAVYLAALAAVLGHCYPVWLRFKGGKGVATCLGVFLVLSPLAVLVAVAVFIGAAVATRTVSIGSITSAAAFPLAAWWIGSLAGMQLAVILCCSAVVIWAHRANIARIVAGRENKF
jgi:glycerol-3-phosphate acyltransferase PlsY